MPSVWDSAVLATDQDLSDQDSNMPDLGKKVVRAAGRTAYDGKRSLVKRDIGSWLIRHDYSLAGILTPSQLTRAAVFLELAYIYTDMAQGKDTISQEKADQYYELYERELEGLPLDYQEPASSDIPTTKTQLTRWRG